MLKLTDKVTWLEAFFMSTSTRTAGYATYPMNAFTNAGLFVMIILMFIGASPGSTGGGIKTTQHLYCFAMHIAYQPINIVLHLKEVFLMR